MAADPEILLTDSELLNLLARGMSILLEARETDRKQLDHLDEMLHELRGFVADNRPHLERALTLMDPGAGWRRHFGKTRAAGNGEHQ